MLPQNHNKSIWFVISIIFVLLIGNLIFTQYQIIQLKNMLSQKAGATGILNTQPITQSGINTITDTCGSVCQAYINNAIETQLKVSTSSSTTSLSPKTQIIYQAPPTQTQVTYIPLSGGNTQNTDWTTISSSQITFNISDYGGKAYPVWDANLRVDNANGQTFVRLFDTTHGIAVNGSEISISKPSTAIP